MSLFFFGLALAKDDSDEGVDYGCDECVERNWNTKICHIGSGMDTGVQYTVGEYWEGYEFEPDQDMVDWPDTITINGKTIDPQDYLQADGKHFDIVDLDAEDGVYALSIADKIEICAWLSTAVKEGVAEQLEADVEDFNLAWNVHYEYNNNEDEWHCHMEYEYIADDSDDFWIWNCEEVQDEEEGEEKRRRFVKRRRRRSGYFSYQLGDGDDENAEEGEEGRDAHETGASEFGECEGGFYRGYWPNESIVAACNSGCERAGTQEVDFSSNTETLITVPVGTTLSFSNVDAVYQFYSVASCNACTPSQHPYTVDGYEALLEVIPGSSHTLLNEGLRCFAPYDMETYEADCSNRVLVQVAGCSKEAQVTFELAEAAEPVQVAGAVKEFLENMGVEVTIATQETVEGILPSLRADAGTTTTAQPDEEDGENENNDENRRRVEQLEVLMDMYDMNVTLSELEDMMVNNLEALNEIMAAYGLPEITAIGVEEASNDAQENDSGSGSSFTHSTPFLLGVAVIALAIVAYFFYTVCSREEYSELSDKRVSTGPTQLADAQSYGAMEAGNNPSVRPDNSERQS